MLMFLSAGRCPPGIVQLSDASAVPDNGGDADADFFVSFHFLSFFSNLS